jgi:hypothetical protein
VALQGLLGRGAYYSRHSILWSILVTIKGRFFSTRHEIKTKYESLKMILRAKRQEEAAVFTVVPLSSGICY